MATADLIAAPFLGTWAEEETMTGTRLLSLLIVVLLAGLVALHSQTLGQKERFTAVAIVNNNLGSGAGVVQIDITSRTSRRSQSC
jgi:hypothetical protein